MRTFRVVMIGCAGSIGSFSCGTGVMLLRRRADCKEEEIEPNLSLNFTCSISIAAAVKGVTNRTKAFLKSWNSVAERSLAASSGDAKRQCMSSQPRVAFQIFSEKSSSTVKASA